MSNYETSADSGQARTAPGYFTVAAWSVPVLMLGDFVVGDVGWYAAIPIAAMLYAVFRERSVRALRWWVGGLVVLFAIPLLADTESGGGVMQDMHPVNLVLFGLAAAVVLVKLHRSHRD